LIASWQQRKNRYFLAGIKLAFIEPFAKFLGNCKKRQGTTSEAAEKLKTEGDGGFIPRVKPA
jgi:hypothetical protein